MFSKIDVGQDRLLRIAIEDDEVEVLDLAAEQIGDRKGDQRQFVDRRAIGALLRRAQDGEMHEIDVGVGFQQIAPHSFARMRLAGDQQHPELVAHALDVDHGAIAVGGDFAFDRRDFELNHVRARMVDRRLHIDPLPDLGVDRRDRFAVAPHRELDRLAVVGAVKNAGFDDLIFADNAVARRLNELDTPLPLAFVTGDQRMQRRVEAKRSRGLRNVVRVAVGDDDRAADPVGRRIGERAPQSSEQFGPFGFGFVARGFDDPQIDVSKRLEPRLELVARFVCLLRPLADVLALGTIDHQRRQCP